jgi:hypothetical protein
MVKRCRAGNFFENCICHGRNRRLHSKSPVMNQIETVVMWAPRRIHVGR